MAITAKVNLHGHDLANIVVLNPGDWMGKTWLLEVGGSYSSLYLVVEARCMCDAIDVLADNKKYGHLILVEEEHLGDYPEDSRHYSGSGQVLDLDHLMIHGDEQAKQPFQCLYFGEGLPEDGVQPTEFEHPDQD